MIEARHFVEAARERGADAHGCARDRASRSALVLPLNPGPVTRSGRVRQAAAAAAVSLALAAPCWSDNPPTDAGAKVLGAPLPPVPPTLEPAWTKWFNPATAPFIPVPLISADPNSGLTIGLIPTWITTDAHDDVSRIVAPDVLYNPNFGFGVHARVFSFSSADEQWSMVAGIKERVEREFDGEYQIGRSRNDRWSINYSLIYDRDGTT